MTKLGIIAGHGDLLKMVLKECQAQHRPYFVLAYKGQTDVELIKDHPHQWVTLGKVGQALNLLKQEGVAEIVMAGRFLRPESWADLSPDLQGAKLLAKIVGRPMGDDGLFRVLVSFLEAEGFTIVSPESIIGDHCLSPLGLLSKTAPDSQAQADIARGLQVAQAIGQVDVGQAVIVQQGIVLGVEAVEGTDELIMRTIALKLEGLGGVLVKIIKPGQETRVDRSVIGVQTLKKCHQAGLRGVAIQAQGVILLGQEEMITYANKHDLFLVGVDLERIQNRGDKGTKR